MECLLKITFYDKCPQWCCKKIFCRKTEDSKQQLELALDGRHAPRCALQLRAAMIGKSKQKTAREAHIWARQCGKIFLFGRCNFGRLNVSQTHCLHLLEDFCKSMVDCRQEHSTAVSSYVNIIIICF